jgi:predicted nucleic acid-binding protein
MRTVFADTFYLVALLNPKDQWHRRAIEVKNELGAVRLIITEAILVEILNYFCSYGAEMRKAAAKTVRVLLNHPDVEVLPQTAETFLSGLSFYEARFDKGYSQTDCISMYEMKRRGVNEVLTHDTHFAQEGFIILL